MVDLPQLANSAFLITSRSLLSALASSTIPLPRPIFTLQPKQNPFFTPDFLYIVREDHDCHSFPGGENPQVSFLAKNLFLFCDDLFTFTPSPLF